MAIIGLLIFLSIGKILLRSARIALAYVRLSRACHGTGVRPSDALASVRATRNATV